MTNRAIRISNLEDSRGHRAVGFGVMTREGPVEGEEPGHIEPGRKRDVEVEPGQIVVVGAGDAIEALFHPAYLVEAVSDEDLEPIKVAGPGEITATPSFESAALDALKHGGALVSSGVCSEMEIADARARGDFYVNRDGFGFVHRPPEWLDRVHAQDGYLQNGEANPNAEGPKSQPGTPDTDADPLNPNVEQTDSLTGMDWGKPDAQAG